MHHIARLRNRIMPYAWGSRRAIRALRGLPGNAATPEAEWWFGGHAKAPSEVWTAGGWQPLPEVVARDPDAVLGPEIARRFDGRLPFLLKVLAAAEPLSIQAHPNDARARTGFARENARGIPIGAPHRNYRDASDKPELIVALTPFAMMRGFRRVSEIRRRIAELGLDRSWPESASLGSEGGLRTFLARTLRLPRERSRDLVAAASAAAAASGDEADRWLVRLAARYPDDTGALAPLWLRVQTLQPGEAVFTGPGVLHAYLGGTGIEIMASSDNVLRGGLTPKHVDVDELLEVLRFAPAGDGRVGYDALSGASSPARFDRYITPARAFTLARLALAGRHVAARRSSVEILLCTEGQMVVETDARADLLGRGDAVLIPAAVRCYRLDGEGVAFVAGVPT